MEPNLDQLQKLGYSGNLEEVIKQVAEFYNIGNIINSKYLDEGYEDYNIKLVTNNGNYVLKLFSNNQLGNEEKTRRGSDVVERLVEILDAAEKLNLNTPRLKKNNDNEVIFRGKDGLVAILFNWIEGTTYYDLDIAPNHKELELIIEQAAKINKEINIHPVYYYDIWAVTNINEFYEKIKNSLKKEDIYLMKKVLKRYNALPIDTLPKCFVHGDFTKGNVIKTTSGIPSIIDFSVSNWTIRIIELSLIISNLMYSSKKKISLQERVKEASDIYTKYNYLTTIELESLYDLSLASASMEFLGGTWRQVFWDDTSEETKYWLNLGKEEIRNSLV